MSGKGHVCGALAKLQLCAVMGLPWMLAVAALNDALQALGMKVTYQAPVSAGLWIVTDDDGTQYQFKVCC